MQYGQALGYTCRHSAYNLRIKLHDQTNEATDFCCAYGCAWVIQHVGPDYMDDVTVGA